MAEEKKDVGEKIDSDLIVSALQFFQKVYKEKEVIIKFEKKDKTMRVMRCTLDFQKIPQEHKPKGVNIQQILKLIQVNQVMHVYDLDVNGWRSVPFKSVEYLETRDKRYFIRKDKNVVTKRNIKSNK
jgi:hypothetical protein